MRKGARARDGQTAAVRGELTAGLRPALRRFISTEAGSAGLLLAAAIVALVWANSPLSDAYESLWETHLSISLGEWGIDLDLREWLDEGFMALFFFVIGLQVRQELAIGELRDRTRVSVPVIAGIGGMVVPVLVFLAIAPSGEAVNGWGVVIATDTAFMLGALAIVGPSCPTQLRVFLLTLSIVDDIVAISLIGVVYSGALDAVALAATSAFLAAIAIASALRIWHGWVYALLGLGAWVAALESGLHPTIAGMAAGLLVTAYAPHRERVEQAASAARSFRQSPLASLASDTRRSLTRATPPNERLQDFLLPWTGFVIVPLFALANAGVDLRGGVLGDALSSPLTWGVAAGLAAGKTIGISVGAIGAVRLRLGRLVEGVGEGQVVGGAALSGIGFTVSLLIVGLAFDSEQLRDEARVGILIGAVGALAIGWTAFRLAATLRGEYSASLPRQLDPPVDPERDHVRGPADAPLTLIEFADFECPFCGRATGTVRDLRRRFGDELRYVFRSLPLVDVHPHSEIAAEAMEEAAVQGRFWEMHDKLFDHQDELEIEDLLGYAGEIGLDVEEVARALEDRRHAERVREQVRSAEASGARSTPTFYVGGLRHVGPYDADTLAAELERSRGGGLALGPEARP